MTSAADKRKARLIEKAATLAVKRIGGAGKASARRYLDDFVRSFYAHVPPDDLLGESADNLAGAALSIWRLAQQRKPGEAKVRVYTPDPERDGWQSRHSVVEIVNDDMPFLVDSVNAEINRRDAEVRLVIHPIMGVARDGRGRLVALHPEDQAQRHESVMQVRISEQPVQLHNRIAEGVRRVLDDVRAAVEDWRPMLGRCEALIEELESTPPQVPAKEIAEGLAFLRWLADDHFTFLGYREYRYRGQGTRARATIVPDSGLGLLRDESVSVFDGLRNLGQMPPDVREFVHRPDLLRITKGNRRSTVHRSAHLDTVAVKAFDGKGRVIGERLFIGLFTSVAYSRSPRIIPLLRQKVDDVVARAGFPPNSHDAKALLHILETYPRDELFQIGVDELFDIATGILHLQERQRTALFVRRDPFERFVSCLVFVPRDRYDTRLRRRLLELIAAAYGGEVASFSTQLGDAALARLHAIVRTADGKIPQVDVDALEQRLAEAARSWSDHLQAELVARLGEGEGLLCGKRYEKAFPLAYQDDYDAADAVVDIAQIEAALAQDGLSMNLYRPAGAPAQVLHFKLYVVDRAVPLSDVLPMLENMGLRVIGEVPYETRPGDGSRAVWIQNFMMEVPSPVKVDIAAVRGAFQEAFARVWNGTMEDDGFNRLVLYAGLTARQVILLRALCKYLRQAQIPFSQTYMEQTLARNPKLAALLVELFAARFDPARQKGAAQRVGRLRQRILDALDAVANLDEDRIIRRYLNAIESMLRTNFYQPSTEGGEKTYVAFKLDSGALDDLPLPRPFREIFVYAPQVEGVHLRFGKVARGGLRWSDRLEDFRTEVLGLVKAQQVKNVVIVPVGSKGGFVVKRPPAPELGREAVQAEGIACYKTFIRGLLDVTDNLDLKRGRVLPPKDVVRYDDDDPYLVVAADKGTATFSDIANGVSQEYGFWLDDAFASGGSAGYDHKKMGITARGAWESVKRHFRELGKDIQSEDFTCVGVGDMSGDVFGNGMLLSKHIRLLGAFNHLHVFVDPDPDPAKSWAERKRLFALPRSAWTDYNADLISKGGGVFERSAKSIKTTPEMRKAFGISAEQLTPNQLIQAMLRADVELLWFGGIGTYVKAAEESHAAVGDRVNDGLRVDARELRAQVVGEGANLGMTQRGRIEYALTGGHCNTDAIDNSAGVDCSDHEVNIKILLAAVEQTGALTRKQRDRLLERMTDEVAEACLRDNYLQSQAITVTHQLGAHLLDRLGRFMRSLEKDGRLNRAIEFLPDDEALAERVKDQRGLTRPELAVLLSYAKLALYDELLESGLPDSPFMSQDLTDYFPTPLRQKYPRQIAGHRLHREIKATVATNEIVNRLGPTFVHEVREKTGMPAEQIARAYMIAREIFGMRALWDEIEALDNKVPAQLQATMLVECGRLIERETVWFLREVGAPLELRACVGNYGPGVAALTRRIGELMSEENRKVMEDHAAQYREQGAPKDLAARVAALGFLSPVCDIVRCALNAGLPVEQVGRLYFKIGERFGFDWLRRAAAHLPTDTAWDKLAVTAVVDDLYGHQSDLIARLLDRAGGKPDQADAVIESWARARRPQIARTEQLLAELRSMSAPDLAMLAVANRQLKSMVSG